MKIKDKVWTIVFSIHSTGKQVKKEVYLTRLRSFYLKTQDIIDILSAAVTAIYIDITSSAWQQLSSGAALSRSLSLSVSLSFPDISVFTGHIRYFFEFFCFVILFVCQVSRVKDWSPPKKGKLRWKCREVRGSTFRCLQR